MCGALRKLFRCLLANNQKGQKDLIFDKMDPTVVWIPQNIHVVDTEIFLIRLSNP